MEQTILLLNSKSLTTQNTTTNISNLSYKVNAGLLRNISEISLSQFTLNGQSSTQLPDFIHLDMGSSVNNVFVDDDAIPSSFAVVNTVMAMNTMFYGTPCFIKQYNPHLLRLNRLDVCLRDYQGNLLQLDSSTYSYSIQLRIKFSNCSM